MIKGVFGWLPKVLNRSMIKVFNRSTKELDNKDRHADFSNLPTLVLWMIKDRLDFVNNLTFAYVCKSWRDATLSYYKNVRLCGATSPPWLMIKKGAGRCKFISTTTGKRYSIFHRDFCGTKTLFTKQGWLLLVWTKKRKNKKTGLGRRLILLNPFINSKIELPDEFSWSLNFCNGAFTLVDGKPELVAFAASDRLWTIRVADGNSLWTEHTSKTPRSCRDYFFPRRVFIIGENVYIVCMTLKLLVFNLSSCEWVSGRHFSRPEYVYIDTIKGVIWNAGPRRLDAASGMSRLNENSREWEKHDLKEMVNKCAFLSHSRQYDDGFVLSKDVVDDAVFSNLVKCGYLIKMRYNDEDDPNTLTWIIMYIVNHSTTNVRWVDMPPN